MQSLSKNLGFSLIEMMIVVAILGTLTGIAIPNFVFLMKRSNGKLTVSQLINFSRSISAIREVEGKAVAEITGSFCTRCDFAAIGDHRSTWTPSTTTIEAYKKLGFSDVPKDVWGGYYLLNEEELSHPCWEDLLRSAGANGVFESNATGSDDIWINIPKFYGGGSCPIDGILTSDSAFTP